MLHQLVAPCLVAIGLAGCASTDTAIERDEPELRFSGSIAPGEARGERTAQVVGALESRLLSTFPRATWRSGNPAGADVLLDVTVFSARTTDTRSSQEQRECRRWSQPTRDSGSTLQKLLSRNCLDWQVRQIPCLTRSYELDVQIRARSGIDNRTLASDRNVVTSTDRRCGDQAPALAALQANAESRIADWGATLLRSPLAGLGVTPAATLAPRETTPATAPEASLAVAPANRPAGSALRPAATLRPATSLPSSGTDGLTLEAHALVIGNANYPGSARLLNPLNDARAMARKLAELGFRVTRIEDGDRDALVRGLTQFRQQAEQSLVTLLYYSGHGMQIDGVNYLMPVNIDPARPDSLKLQSLPLQTVIDSYLPGTTRIVFLDACRDNPIFTAATRGFGRGLAPVQAPTGTLIAYAARDGGVAEDGTGRHSPFTQALLDLIAEPEDISLVLRRVRDRVMHETAGRQQPWEYGSLSGGTLVLSRLLASH